MSAPDQEPQEDPLARRIAYKAERRRHAERHRARSAWFGLGMYGMVGWSIAIPTLIGVALGIWIDERWPSEFSWTLMLLAGGLLLGCWNAWYLISLEQRAIQGRDEQRDDDDG